MTCLPVLTPASTTSLQRLPVTGTAESVSGSVPYGIYNGSEEFISGAVDQVSFVYKHLGGDMLNIELVEGQVYAAYEAAVLEYSYIVNVHQAKNSLGNMLGNTTASFDEDGEVRSGESLSGSHIELRYPRFAHQATQRIADGIGGEAGHGGDLTMYSASFTTTSGKQDYDLQAEISSSAQLVRGDTIGNKKVTVRQVFYLTPRAMWRFFAYYGGLNVIGNLSSYGQYSDDTTYEVVPAWQNKLQAIQYEDSLRTRISHYSYEIQNNIIRIFPVPDGFYPEKFWVRFTVEQDAWEEDSDRTKGGEGINNMNSLPFANIPYVNINSIGKHWIRRFALAISKEMLGQVRGKLGSLPIAGGDVTLNHSELLSQAADEKEKLREELKAVLDELTYAKLAERDKEMMQNVVEAGATIPKLIYMG